jgi:Domain of unknown function (DUF1840)
MLISFDTPAYSRVTMFGDVALKLLDLMGMSGAVPGALRPEDIPAALTKLKQGLNLLPPDVTPKAGEDSPHVSLSKRAFPLIQLLEAAASKGKHVTWEQER